MDIKNLAYGTPLVCNYCGKEFIRSREHPGIRYCSVTCQKDAQKKKYLEKRNEIGKNSTSRIHICAYCGKEFHYDTQKNGQKYCSEECKRKSNRKINTESEDEVADVVRYLITKMKQASASDMSVLTIHTEKLNPTEHQRILILRRDKNRCRVCNSRSNLEIHHIIKRRDGGCNNLDNLITLCRKCHRHIETGNMERAIKKCAENYIRVRNGESSIFAFHLNNLEKVNYAKDELNKLYNIIVNSGEYTNTESIKVCIDDILEHIE